MFSKKSSTKNCRSYLSPQTLKCYQLNQSPRFDVEKALQQQIQRKRINQQKLARYDEYNSLLAGRIMKDFNQNKEKQRSQLKKYSPSLVKSDNTSSIASQNTKNSKIQKIFQDQGQKNPNLSGNPQQQQKTQQQKYLQLLRQKHQNLQRKNRDLKQYLGQITQGAGQLQCILQEVQTNYEKLKKIHPQQFDGLWLTNHDVDDDYDIQGYEQFQKQINEKDTDVTMNVDVEGKRWKKYQGQNDNIKTQQQNQYQRIKKPLQSPSSSLLKLTNPLSSYQSQQRLKLISQIQTKFKSLLQQSSQRLLLSPKNSNNSQIYQLNRIQKQLDKLKSYKNNKIQPSISHIKSLNSLHSVYGNHLFDDPYQGQNQRLYQKLSKVKSSTKLY